MRPRTGTELRHWQFSLPWDDGVQFCPEGEVEGLHPSRNRAVKKKGEGRVEGRGIGDEGRETQ